MKKIIITLLLAQIGAAQAVADTTPLWAVCTSLAKMPLPGSCAAACTKVGNNEGAVYTLAVSKLDQTTSLKIDMFERAEKSLLDASTLLITDGDKEQGPFISIVVNSQNVVQELIVRGDDNNNTIVCK